MTTSGNKGFNFPKTVKEIKKWYEFYVKVTPGIHQLKFVPSWEDVTKEELAQLLFYQTEALNKTKAEQFRLGNLEGA